MSQWMRHDTRSSWASLDKQRLPHTDEDADPAEAATRVLPQSPAGPAPAFARPHPAKQHVKGDAGLGRRHLRERIVGIILTAFSMVSIFTTLGIVGVLLYEAFGF